MDRLKKIFDMQHELAVKMPSAGDTCSERVANLCTALIHEGIELQRLTDWKWWKQPTKLNTADASDELADIVHFVIQIALELGMDEDDLLKAYERKNTINHERQSSGY